MKIFAISIVIISQGEYTRFICLRISKTTISPWGRDKKEYLPVSLMNTSVECLVSAREGDVIVPFLPSDSLYVLYHNNISNISQSMWFLNTSAAKMPQSAIMKTDLRKVTLEL